MERIKYRLLTFVRYLGDSLYYPFLSLYLKQCGFIESKIGFILSLSPLIGILINPIYTKICKSLKITKNILTVITILEAIFIALIGLFHSFNVVTFLSIMLAIFGSCHYGMMDSLIAVFSEDMQKFLQGMEKSLEFIEKDRKARQKAAREKKAAKEAKFGAGAKASKKIVHLKSKEEELPAYEPPVKKSGRVHVVSKKSKEDD